MGKARKSMKMAIFVFVAVFVLAQAIRVERLNPPVQAEVTADPAVKPLLRRACYDCHSNETIWPWYSNVAPASWLIASDVEEGRSNLNFSEWGSLGSDAQSHKLADIAKQVQEGEMPLWYYTLPHPEARLSPAERSKLQDWAASGIAVQASE